MAWYHTAIPGDKIVCINDTIDEFSVPGLLYAGDLDGLSKGTIYTVKKLYVDQFDDVMVDLVEITRADNPNFADGDSLGYNAKRFRPVSDSTTKIGAQYIRSVLNKSKVPCNA